MAGLRFASLGAGLGGLLVPALAHAATYYVAPTGNDMTGMGTMAAPFGSWARAQTAAAPGDTVYFRGGVYKYTEATSICKSQTASVSSLVLTKSGTSGNPIRYFAYEGEKPVFDFSGVTDKSRYDCRHVGVNVRGDWLYLKGLEFKGVLQVNNVNHESWCIYVNGGSNNVFEMLDAHHNMGPGFFVQRGGHNTFLNCDSHENEDTLTSNGDGQSADGFGCHPTHAGDTDNVFRGCRAWWNTDDNWDFISASAACTVEYSWAWYAGYKPGVLNNGAPVSLSEGNGNGIKAGGFGDPPVNLPNPSPQHTVRFNVSFYNKVAGFYANHDPKSSYFYNNTAFNNGVGYDMLGLNASTATSVGILRNNIAFSTNGKSLTRNTGNSGPISDQFNSWNAATGVQVTEADFQSVAFKPAVSCPPTDKTCFAGMASARGADGSLPVVPFLRLAAQSDLIDKGTDVKLPFAGKAPDLGAFETGLVVGVGGAPGGGGAGGGGNAPAFGGSSADAGAPDVAGTGGDGTTTGNAGSAGRDTAPSAGSGDASDAGGPSAAAGGMARAGAPQAGEAPASAAGRTGDNDGDDDGGVSCRVAGAPRSPSLTLFASGLLLSAALAARRILRKTG